MVIKIDVEIFFFEVMVYDYDIYSDDFYVEFYYLEFEIRNEGGFGKSVL